MKNIIRKTVSALVAFFCLFTSCKGSGENYPTHFLLTGEVDSPVTFCISSPEYTNLAQFGKDRLDSLNRLLRHISVTVSVKDNGTETVLSIDQEPLVFFEEKNDIHLETTELTQKDQKEKDVEKDEFSAFLDERYFVLNHLMDGLYPMFCKVADSFPELSGKSSATLNFSGFGKSVRRTTIQFPAEYVSERFPAVLTQLCDNQSARTYIEQLMFQGSQKIVLLYDQNDNLLRINYDGTVGTSADEMRRVSIVWKCMRNAEHIKDSLTIKTPAVTGYNRDNISYERDLDISDSENHKLKWDYQLDQKKEKVKTKIRYTGDLNSVDTNISGKISYNVKGDSIPEHSMIIKSGMEKEKEAEYAGTLEITNKTGKIVTSSVISGFSICNSIYSSEQKTEQDGVQIKLKDIQIQDDRDIPEDVIRTLIRKMITLPEEDTEFLRKDIPDEIWTIMTNH